jgi:hypothetical protein
MCEMRKAIIAIAVLISYNGKEVFSGEQVYEGITY